MATSADMSVVLTTTAGRYAARQGVLDQVLATALPATCQVGDLVSFEIEGMTHEFVLLRRRWIAGEGSTRLEVTLDYPAHGGR
ncbi:hypothetical protein M2281_003336 [Mesorhizobium soli]|uniref:hypothetical protein n=1 Tax=Pseudaminobacter soli (ex Li et al. 2025) TaxID=1295366 RepID=UPI00247641E0|nr:hypothetical protein [Mesorhizobium soli]MDH6232737.1 hypothetical protein [Mesorhizobium soli]